MPLFHNFVLVLFISEITDKLIKEGVLSKSGEDSYNINKKKVAIFHMLISIFDSYLLSCLNSFPFLAMYQLQKFDYDFDVVKEETNVQMLPIGKYSTDEGLMYMKVSHFEISCSCLTKFNII